MNLNPSPKAQAPAWAFAIEPMSKDRYALFQGGDLSLVTINDLRSFLDKAISGSERLGGDAIH